MKPKVSIVCITYNQSDYIRQTLDSFLMQKTDFAFEVLIHDDASTDGTMQILQEYEKKYPEIVKPTYETENQYSSGDYDFINDLFRKAKGGYIAFCEGDDFWTDENKLQLQADFLDKNKDYALCFHPVKVFFEKGEQPDSIFPEVSSTKEFTTTNLLKQNFIQSNSVMYRRKTYKGIPSKIIPSDWYMHLYHAQDGKIGFVNKVMSAYRRQSGGVWWATFKNVDLIWRKFGIQHLDLYVELQKIYNEKPVHIEILNRHIDSIVTSLGLTDAKYHMDLIKRATTQFPDVMSSSHARLIEKNLLLQAKVESQVRELTDNRALLEREKATVFERDAELKLIKGSKLWKVRGAIKKPAKLIRRK